jgi:hypothetical protein
MLSLHDILFAFLLPGCVCGAILLAAARGLTAGDRGRRWNDVLGAWAFGGAYLFAHFELVGFPAWPSAERTPSALDWLAWCIAALMPCALVYLFVARERSFRRSLRGLFSAALVMLSLRGWLRGDGSTWLAALALILVIVAWATTEALVRRSPGPVPVLPLFVTMLCVSVSSLLGHSALVAELAGALCVCLGASAVVSLLAPRFQLSSGSVAVTVLVLAGMLLNGVFFSDVHWSSALLALASLIVPWLARRGAGAARGGWRAAAIGAGLALLFGAAAVVAAHLNAPSYDY